MSSLYQLLIWNLAFLYRLLKRRAILASLGILSVVLLLVFSFKWGLMCLNTQPLFSLKDICVDYQNGYSVGKLCNDLCNTGGGITSISCQTFHMGKELVFTGVHGNNSIVFKLPNKHKNEELHWLDNSNNKIYPSEAEFSGMITTSIKLRFNISVNHIDAKKMSYIHYAQNGPLREIEMENVWRLLQDNEYLALSLYAKFEIFPQLIGSCGSMYAVQKLESLSRFSHFLAPYSSQDSWVRRVKISVMILDFLLRLDSGLPETLQICDVKMDHFGITSDFKKVQYLDLDSVHPLSITNRITGDGSPCERHRDCDFLDCRSFCNLVSRKCEFGVVNNNLQIVCEKIFLGWMWAGRVAVPGLLGAARAPRPLLELLRRCADPDGDAHAGAPRAPASKQIGLRLHNFLSHLTS